MNCKKTIDRHKRNPEDHVCGEWQCGACKQFVNTDHLCYLRALECKENNPRYIFFDFECTQEDTMCCEEGYLLQKNPECVICCNEIDPCLECSVCANCRNSWCGKPQHKPNLVVTQKVCEECIDQELAPRSKCDNCGTRCKKCKKNGLYPKKIH